MSKLIYFKPAKRWKEALPLGNGKLGAMVFGGVRKEVISLNDATLWSGYPRNYDNADSKEYLDQARSLIFEGKNAQADELVKKYMHGEYSQSFLPLADLMVSIGGDKSKGYRRILDLNSGIIKINTKRYSSECFVSHPSDMMFYKMDFADGKNVSVKLRSRLRARSVVDDGILSIVGNAPDNVVPNYVRSELRPLKYNEGKAMAFGAAVKVITDGAVSFKKNSIQIKSAKSILLAIVTDTGFKSYDRLPSVSQEECLGRLKNRLSVRQFDYEEEKKKHIEDFSSIVGREKLNLFGDEKDTATLLRNAKAGSADKYLCNLLYDYGKYLLASGSRESQPLNLQGLWNKSVRPPWSSNLTTNINFQMNYWSASACNLDECLTPFYKALEEIAERGKDTAKINYGTDGFVCNHNVDIWRMTSPVKGNPAYMYAPLCGVWLANEAYSHSVTQHGEVEDRILKISQEASKFCLDYLVDSNGELVTCPSASPEAEFYENGKRVSLDYASAFEMGIISQCFDNVLASCKDAKLKERITSAKQRLRCFCETTTGLNEWHNDKKIAEKGHRHFSPLYSLYPAKQIGYYKGGKNLALAKKLFEYRMANAHNSIGWSAAWAICIYARLHDGNGVKSIIDGMCKRSLFPNLFGYHPPAYFQIDGNMGFVAGVNESLVYEEDGIIDLLPACPEEWTCGKVEGFKVGGAEISFRWKDRKVVEIKSNRQIKINAVNLAQNAVIANVTVVNRD